jgi:hypothetical protein
MTLVFSVMSFVICLNPKYDYSESKQRYELVKNLAHFRGISKTFHAAPWQFISCSPIPQVISDVQLSEIKACVARLDLSTLCSAFIKEVRKTWDGENGMFTDEREKVEFIIEHFGPNADQVRNARGP